MNSAGTSRSQRRCSFLRAASAAAQQLGARQKIVCMLPSSSSSQQPAALALVLFYVRGGRCRCSAVCVAWYGNDSLFLSSQFSWLLPISLALSVCRYPSDADKHLLARQTGLSRNQVSLYACARPMHSIHWCWSHTELACIACCLLEIRTLRTRMHA